MKKKIHVGIVFGGRSSEHQVSLVSAKSVLEAIPRDKYEPVMIGIDLIGTWHHIQTDALLLDVSSIDSIHLPSGETQLTADMGNARAPFTSLEKKDFYESIDVVFPILHGKNGEDGTMQGFLQLMDIPFVGPETLGSAIGMDKDVCKRLLRDAGISVAKWVTIRKDDKINMELLEKTLGFPMFVKPANAGSSVGVGKAKNITDLLKAIVEAFVHDEKILVEEAIEGREIECAVLGNMKNMRASIAGEVIPHHDFYSYKAKYLDENGAGLVIPADIPETALQNIQKTAIKTCRTLECEGMSRVDFFLKKDGSIVLNEINTIPGFTKISMYPKLWEASGVSYPDLIDTLLQLAIERHKRRQ
jgi:D-alanine-D-alanine ligase